ncbi:hypothetical protein F4805DRAFT_478935 [Annulohypoxylon moriforme]|nr:hypothetical protein F4805DRAFT_478935 [Annulohypoxylon moriforme]
MGKEVVTHQPQSLPASKQLAMSLVLKTRKHAALKGNPIAPVSKEQWENINQAIIKTVELILSKNVTLDSFGPDYWEMDEGLGVALVAEIRREIKELCTLRDPKLQRELMKMARDITHKEFRFPYRGGGVWFRFKMTNLQKAAQPIIITESDSLPNTVKIIPEITEQEVSRLK